MIKEPKTLPIPAPDPATPTVAAPAPMYLAAESISMTRALVWKLLTRLGAPHEAVRGEESPWYVAMGAEATGAAALSAESARDAKLLAKGRTAERELWAAIMRAALVQANILVPSILLVVSI